VEIIPLLKQLFAHIERKRKIQFSFLFVVLLAASLFEALSIGAILPLLSFLASPSSIIENSHFKLIFNILDLNIARHLPLIVISCFITIVITTGILRILLLWMQTRLSHAIGADLSISMYRRTLYQPYSVHLGRNSSEVIAGISRKANDVVTIVIFPILLLISSFLILSAIIITLLFVNAAAAISALLGFGSIYVLITLITKRRIARDGESISREQTQVIKALQEGLGGIRDVLIDGTQEVYCEIYRTADIPLRRAQANLQILSGIPRFAIEALGMVLIALLALFLTSRQNEFIAAIPVLGALALGAQRLLPSLQQMYQSWSNLLGGKATLRDALVLLDQPLPKIAQRSREKIQFDSKISFKDVSFRYSDSTPLILSGINFDIPKGARIGVIGSTGSGKSTLIDLIMALLSPTDGEILIDQESLSPFNRDGWQSHIAHVPQSIFLSDSTILENIAFGIPKADIDLEEVQQAAKKAQIHETIISLSDGYETFVGERGVRLSGGQRQRIGIARALYKKANVLIFDEATSALDTKTEEMVMKSIGDLNEKFTIIIIAHRISTLKQCTQIIELGPGGTASIKSYAQLIHS